VPTRVRLRHQRLMLSPLQVQFAVPRRWPAVGSHRWSITNARLHTSCSQGFGAVVVIPCHEVRRPRAGDGASPNGHPRLRPRHRVGDDAAVDADCARQ
jgi:hypothetical protein